MRTLGALAASWRITAAGHTHSTTKAQNPSPPLVIPEVTQPVRVNVKSHLEHARNILLGDCTSLDVGHELEPSARLAWLEFDGDVRKLTRAARLLLVRVRDVSTLADRLPVVHLARSTKPCVRKGSRRADGSLKKCLYRIARTVGDDVGRGLCTSFAVPASCKGHPSRAQWTQKPVWCKH